jgi:choline-sulfatase
MLRTMRQHLFVGLATLLLLPACGGGSEGGSSSGVGDDDPSGSGPGAASSPSLESLLEGTRVHLDLWSLAHLADFEERGGLYLDFGSPARAHASMGRWRSGWLSDGQTEDRDFTRMSGDGRVFFHVDEAGPMTLRLRGRRLGTRAIVVYLNGRRAGQIDLDEDGVHDHDLALPPERVRAGENALMFRASGTQTVGSEEVTAEIDSLWIFRGEAPESAEAPVFRERVTEVEAGGETHAAVRVNGPAGRVRWYLEVPPDARLGYRVAGAAVRWTATPEGGEAIDLGTTTPEGEGWTAATADLSALAGEVVRLEAAVDGEGAANLGTPRVVVPEPEPLADAEARSVVLLLIDTLRADKLRVHNPDSRVETPALDRWAADAAVFQTALAPENWTKPSVASVLTSLHPMTHGTKEQGSVLPQSAVMVSEVFQDAGFATGSFIANGYVSDRFGFAQGWDHYTNYIREERNTTAENVFDEAIAWIEEHRSERFFAYIQTIDPHVPYDPPEEDLQRYDAQPYDGRVLPRSTGNQLEEAKREPDTYFTARDRRRLEALHDGEITYHDRHFGRFVERLRELGLEDDVLFVITSDHGEEFYEHGSFGHGHSIFNELLHVPLLMRWPGVIGRREITPATSTLDIAPTLLEATGVEIPQAFEGHSLLGTARGVDRPGPAVAFSDKLDDRRVITGGGFKLISRGNLTWALFNLRTDPGEDDQIDDGDRHPIAQRYLRGLLGQYLGATNRRNWLYPSDGEAPSALESGGSVQYDATTCRQLAALGYFPGECDGLL